MNDNITFENDFIMNPDAPKECGILAVKSINEWLEESSRRPDPEKLFDFLWYEGSLCVFFAPTNVGKTILSYQIADALTSGKPIPGFDMPTTPRKVLYIDCEMSDKQIEMRYRDRDGKIHKFNGDNFKRAEIEPERLKDGMTMDDAIIESIRNYMKQNEGNKTIIIDNITCLSSKGTELTKEAVPLMTNLKGLIREDFNVSILVLAHTPKRKDGRESQPMTREDCKGSSDIANLSREMFAMNKSSQTDENGTPYRYIKQLKQTNCAEMYGEENVIILKLDKYGDALKFEKIGTGREAEHLPHYTPEEKATRREEMKQQAKELSENGMSQRAIAKQLNLSLDTVNRYINAAD